MTEQAEATEQQEPSQEEQQSYTKADVERIVADRLRRERDKIGDVKSLKAAAEELAAIKESQKTEAEKQAERLAALEAEARQARTEALRLRIAAKFGVNDDDADLFLTGSDEETLTKQAQRLVDRDAKRRKSGNFVPSEGSQPATSGEHNDAQFARSLFSPS